MIGSGFGLPFQRKQNNPDSIFLVFSHNLVVLLTIQN